MASFNEYPVSREGRTDARYTVRKEYVTPEKPLFVARYNGEWLGQSAFYNTAVLIATCHRCADTTHNH